MKNLTSLILALIMVLTLVGCQSNSDVNEPEPSETPYVNPNPQRVKVDTDFDYAIIYTTPYCGDELYEGALNATGASQRIQPIYKFETFAELEQFKERFADGLDMDQSIDNKPSFNEATAAMDEAYFEKYAVLLIYSEGSSTSKFIVEGIYKCDSELYIRREDVTNSDKASCDVVSHIFLVSVDKAILDGITSFDA